MKSDTKQRFAQYHTQFKSVRHEMLFSPHILDAIDRATRGWVLDVGTADGYKLGRILRRSGGSVKGGIALEPSPLFHQAEDRLASFPDISVLNQAFEEFEAERRFDTIFLFEVIEHVPLEARDEFLSRARALLAEGGSVVLSTPNRAIYRLKCRLTRERPDPTHVREFSFRELDAFLSGHFRLITYYGVLPWMGLVRALPFLSAVNRWLNPVRLSHVFFAIMRSPRTGGRS